MRQEQMNLVQVVFKEGLYLAKSEHNEEGEILFQIRKHDALAIYETKDSAYGDIRILPVESPWYVNRGYIIPDISFVRPIKNVTKEALIKSVRTYYLDGLWLGDALRVALDNIQGFGDFPYDVIKEEYEKKYGKEAEK